MALRMFVFFKISFLISLIAHSQEKEFDYDQFASDFCHSKELKLEYYKGPNYFIKFNGIKKPVLSGSVDSLWLYKSQSKVFVFNGNKENKLKLFMKNGMPVIKFRDTLLNLNDGFLETIEFEREVENNKNVYYDAQNMFNEWSVRFRYNEVIDKIGDIEFYSDKREVAVDYTYSGKKSVRSDYDFFFIQENRVSKTYREFNSSYLFRILNLKKYPEGYAISDKGDNYLISIITEFEGSYTYVDVDYFEDSGRNGIAPRRLYNYKNNKLQISKINVNICK